jgi:predicted SAM-dependent methyltransferase
MNWGQLDGFELSLGGKAWQIVSQLEQRFGHAVARRPPPLRRDGNDLLNLGAGTIQYEGWINADLYNFHHYLTQRRREANWRAPNWRLDATRRWQCADHVFDGIFSQHTLEHLSYVENMALLKECHRTLKPGCWVRISVPDIAKAIEFYLGKAPNGKFDRFERGPIAIHDFTQRYGHRSVWDSALMAEALGDAGFTTVNVVEYMKGSDPRLLKDDDGRIWQSLYVEAQR